MPGHGLLVRPPLKPAKPLNLFKSLEKAIQKLFTNDVMINGWLTASPIVASVCGPGFARLSSLHRPTEANFKSTTSEPQKKINDQT
jgi:hypothetical protein